MNDLFSRPVSEYMAPNVEVSSLETPIEDLARMMHGRAVSGIPVLDGATLAGVVSRTDLINLGLLQSGRRWTSPCNPLPRRVAKDVMTKPAQVVASSAPLHAAARLMHDHQIHRVFVVDEDLLVGVIGTAELAAAVRDARIETPLSEVMTSMIVGIDVHAPLSAAVDLLAKTHVSGLIVTEAGIPIGAFTQLDALASRDLPRGTPIETIYDAGVISLPLTTKLHRAAAHAAQLDVRRIVACRGGDAVGVLGGLDFARVIAQVAR